MRTHDTKLQVITRLLEMARLIRRRGTPDEAEVAVIYERQLENDLQTRTNELNSQKELQLVNPLERREEVHA